MAWGSVNVPGGSGAGLPAGGKAGQIPVKKTKNDYDFEWKTLSAADIGAISASNTDKSGIYANINDDNTATNSIVLGFSNTPDGYAMATDSNCIVIGPNKNPTTSNAIIIGQAQVPGNFWMSLMLGMFNEGNKWATILGEHNIGNGMYDLVCGRLNVTGAMQNSAIYGHRNIATHLSKYKVESFDKTNHTVTLNSSAHGYTVDSKVTLITYRYSSNDRFRFELVDSVFTVTAVDGKTITLDSAWTSEGVPGLVLSYAEPSTIKGMTGTNTFVSIVGSNNVAAGAHRTVLLGNYLVADYRNQVILGCGNKDTSSPFVIGHSNDISQTTGIDRSDIFRIDSTGAVYGGKYNSTGADYAEMFEWADANRSEEDRIGRFVTLDSDKISYAETADAFVLGITSGNPTILGDVCDDHWGKKFVYDIYGRPVMENVVVPAEYDDNGNVLSAAHTEIRQKRNPEYDPTKEFISRINRPEWAAVGMMGKLVLIDDGTCEVNGWAKPTTGGIGTKSDTQTRFRVMARLDDTHVRVLIL